MMTRRDKARTPVTAERMERHLDLLRRGHILRSELAASGLRRKEPISKEQRIEAIKEAITHAAETHNGSDSWMERRMSRRRHRKLTAELKYVSKTPSRESAKYDWERPAVNSGHWYQLALEYGHFRVARLIGRNLDGITRSDLAQKARDNVAIRAHRSYRFIPVIHKREGEDLDDTGRWRLASRRRQMAHRAFKIDKEAARELAAAVRGS